MYGFAVMMRCGDSVGQVRGRGVVLRAEILGVRDIIAVVISSFSERVVRSTEERICCLRRGNGSKDSEADLCRSLGYNQIY